MNNQPISKLVVMQIHPLYKLKSPELQMTEMYDANLYAEAGNCTKPCQRTLNNQVSRIMGSTISSSTLWGSRESRATTFGSGEPDSGHSGGLVGIYTLGVQRITGHQFWI